MSRTTPEPNLPVAEASADQIENGCRGMYGPTWDGPPEKMPGEKMKEVWRTYSKNCLNAALATPIPDTSAGERMREVLEAFVRAYGSQDSFTKGLDDACTKAKAALSLQGPSGKTGGEG